MNIHHQRWVMDNGDHTHNLNHNLTEDSTIIDLGGYTGVWAEQMINKFNPNVYIIEPITSAYNTLVEKFKNNPKVHLLKLGIAPENKKGQLSVNGMRSSSNIESTNYEDVEYNTLEVILDKFGLDNVDLMQINIEGDEYDLMDYIQSKPGLFTRIKKYQIQFHDFVPNAVEKRDKIQNNFHKYYKLNFEYPFVWEAWSLR